MQRAATTRSGLVCDIDHLLDPRQFRWQRTTIAFSRLAARDAHQIAIEKIIGARQSVSLPGSLSAPR
jgi:hypothetical protein